MNSRACLYSPISASVSMSKTLYIMQSILEVVIGREDTKRCKEPEVAPAPDEIVVIGGDGEEQQGIEC